MDNETKQPFMSHLEELRKRLITCAIAVGIGFVISYIFGLGGYLYLSSRDRLRAAEIEIHPGILFKKIGERAAEAFRILPFVGIPGIYYEREGNTGSIFAVVYPVLQYCGFKTETVQDDFRIGRNGFLPGMVLG